MITICVRYGIVPDTSTKGLLIPLLKKPNSDPSIAKNYRPIIISTTFSKLIEIHMLEQCMIFNLDLSPIGAQQWPQH